MQKIIGLLCLTVCFSAGAVERLDQNPNDNTADFNALDINHDGKLSAGEAAKESYFKSGIKVADSNKNGSLNPEEYRDYKSKVQHAENKQAARDAAITAKIKSKYLIEKNFSSLKVSVETKDQMVILSGFVNSQAQKTRAEEIAKSVSHVKSVKNALVVKP